MYKKNNNPLLVLLRNKMRNLVVNLRVVILRKLYKMSIGKDTRISMRAVLDKTNPKGIKIGNYSYISYGAIVLTHDFINKRHIDTVIGNNVFLGAYSVVLPGVKVGHNSIIGAGAIVTKDIPDNSLVAGNPAKIIRSGIKTGKYGKLKE